MNTIVRLMPSVLMCVAVQAFAGDPPTTTPATSSQATSTSSSPSSSTPAASSTNTPAAATETPHRLVLIDKTLTNAEVSQLLSQGYKPQKGRGDTVLYCRSEAQMGTRFEKKTCRSADQMKEALEQGKEETQRLQRDVGNNHGK